MTLTAFSDPFSLYLLIPPHYFMVAEENHGSIQRFHSFDGKFLGQFQYSSLLCKRIVPIQALVLTAVHSRGTPAQPTYPAVHLESTTRATCKYPITGTEGPARTQLSTQNKTKTKTVDGIRKG